MQQTDRQSQTQHIVHVRWKEKGNNTIIQIFKSEYDQIIPNGKIVFKYQTGFIFIYFLLEKEEEEEEKSFDIPINVAVSSHIVYSE